jgi:2-dehydropantoate 2-reductase
LTSLYKLEHEKLKPSAATPNSLSFPQFVATPPQRSPKAAKVHARIVNNPLMRIGIISTNGLARYQSLIVPWSRIFTPRTYATDRKKRMHLQNELIETQDKGGLSGRIHILGMGNIGCFVAHSLASRMTRPPITILLHNRDMYERWLQRKQTIRLMTNGSDDNKTGFDVNVLDNETWYSIPYWDERIPRPNPEEQEKYESQLEMNEAQSSEVDNFDTEDEKIECLIVTTKAPFTVKALSSVSHRLNPDSTVLFLQNGMGVIDEVNEKVFPDPTDRPHYLQGIISHGVKMKKPFHIEYTGLGTTRIGNVLPPTNDAKPRNTDWAPSTKYLARTLTLTPPLVAVAESPIAVFQSQIEKLAMNCVINPLTALLDVNNGELLYNYHMTRTMRMLLAEISTVICALPELDGVPGVKERFSTERLKTLVVKLANATAANTSSMLQDVRAMKMTEIEYINGYIVRRGDELGIRCALNYMIMQLVLGRNHISKLREAGAVPLSPLEAEEMEDEKGL